MTDTQELNLKSRDAYVSWTSATIRYRDLDPNGHVNNGAINEFFEDGRVQFRNDRMISLGDNILAGFALVKFSVEYYKTLHYPGSVDIGTVVTKIGRTSYVLGQGIFSGDECIAVAEVITVCLDDQTQKSQPIGDELRAILANAQNI
jgi:acyl-CoA thioester hydrolase|tara:strand:+ start:1390 stop:1830 length:441 start_codon:yes stop_codon:yes gene_type:complete